MDLEKIQISQRATVGLGWIQCQSLRGGKMPDVIFAGRIRVNLNYACVTDM